MYRHVYTVYVPLLHDEYSLSIHVWMDGGWVRVYECVCVRPCMCVVGMTGGRGNVIHVSRYVV